MSTIDLRHGDCLEVMRDLPDGSVDAVVTDPPYGMRLDTDHKTQQRSRLAGSNDFPPIEGDDKSFDPSPWLRYRTVVLFGANWYADKLPPSGAWIVWDKLDGLTSKRELGFNDNSDCELIWTNVGARTRLVRHRWMGMLKASEQQSRRLHATQKPVALMELIIRHYTRPGDTVLDPFMGSGTTGVACVNTNRNFIGIEKSEEYFAIAEKRINAALEAPKQETFAQ